jgi:hypothetical protein
VVTPVDGKPIFVTNRWSILSRRTLTLWDHLAKDGNLLPFLATKLITFYIDVSPIFLMSKYILSIGTICLVAIASSMAIYTFKNSPAQLAIDDRSEPEILLPPAEDLEASQTIAVATTQTTRKSYYVDKVKGNDNNSGTTEKLAFQTIDRANQQVNPGDTVYVKNGTYLENVTIKISGSPNNWITFKAFPGHQPKILGTSGAFIVEGNYIKIIGFEITSTIENGIAIGGQIGGNHHTQILNNKIHNSGCNGIGGMKTDYLTIEYNIVYQNAFTAPWLCSGISIYQAQNSDQKPGFHNIIRGNISYANENKLSRKDGKVSDGNGIIIDDSKHTQAKTPTPKYTGWTLVENNVVFDNGGRGIHVFQSEHVIVRHNTSFKNSKSPNLDLDGEITALYAADARFYNNIAYARDHSKRTLVDRHSSRNKWDYNLVYNGKTPAAGSDSQATFGTHQTIDIDPAFIMPTVIASQANFRLQAKSPAINIGTPISAAKIDLTGNKRPAGSKYDLGAYEYTTKARKQPSSR